MDATLLGARLHHARDLGIELALTRIFSVVFFYHFAFLAISVALFGLGAGGVVSYVVAARPGNIYAKLGACGLANAACVTGLLWFLVTRPAGLGRGTLLAVYMASAIPFLLSGIVVSSAVAEAIQRVDRASSSISPGPPPDVWS